MHVVSQYYDAGACFMHEDFTCTSCLCPVMHAAVQALSWGSDTDGLILGHEYQTVSKIVGKALSNVTMTLVCCHWVLILASPCAHISSYT